MKCINERFYGKPLFSGLIPYRSTVNNGYMIRSQNYELLEILEKNEYKRGEVIDWFMFKEGETVLIDDKGNKFGCTSVSYGSSIQLDELISGAYYNVTFKTIDSPDNIIPFGILIRAQSKEAAMCIANERLDTGIYKVLNATLVL